MTRIIENVDFAVDEHIWGHRLYDEQLPHLTVLEFLNVLGANTKSPLREGDNGRVHYKPQRQFRLRALLFNNPYVEAIRARPVSDADKWSTWKEHFTADTTGLEESDWAYLRSVFSSFEDFAKTIDLLRSSAFEVRSNKRWSSKFVFPFGPDALYEDLRIGPAGATNDRRFFARSGELLYLMLARAKGSEALGRLLVERLFDRSAPMNRLVRALQGDTQLADTSREAGYLPLVEHSRFDRLCSDWTAILSRDMPIYDALEHLITSAGLNLMLYFLERGKEKAGDSGPVEVICEIVSRERTKVRALSCDCYQSNQALSTRAVRASIEGVRMEEEWATALVSDDPSAACAKIMRDTFQWPPATSDGDDTDYTNMPGDDLIQRLIDKAESRHEQHFGKIHAAWSRAVGLSSRRLSRRTRYAPNDRLLKTLVISVVEDRMQFDEFLRELRSRYGLVIGDAEGVRLVKDKLVDQEALSENRAHLEARLASLGLVRRLSDSCSFVENPFANQVEAS